MFLFKKPVEEIYIYDQYKDYLFLSFILNHEPLVLMSCRISGNSIHINDIKPCPRADRNKCINKGYGSQLMTALLEYASKQNIIEIFGELSAVDLDHRDRLHHFYQKFGFEISIYPEIIDCFYGRISKFL